MKVQDFLLELGNAAKNAADKCRKVAGVMPPNWDGVNEANYTVMLYREIGNRLETHLPEAWFSLLAIGGYYPKTSISGTVQDYCFVDLVFCEEGVWSSNRKNTVLVEIKPIWDKLDENRIAEIKWDIDKLAAIRSQHEPDAVLVIIAPSIGRRQAEMSPVYALREQVDELIVC